MSLEEQDYYLLHSEPPDPPQPGFILLMRVPHTNVVKVVYPAVDGETINQSAFIAHDCPEALLKFEKAGVPKEKMERTFDYLWNYNKAYVRTPDWKPKIAPKDAPKPTTSGTSALDLITAFKEAIAVLQNKEPKTA